MPSSTIEAANSDNAMALYYLENYEFQFFLIYSYSYIIICNLAIKLAS